MTTTPFGATIRPMQCSFCDAVKVKMKQITYKGKLSLVCLTCEEFDGIKGDK